MARTRHKYHRSIFFPDKDSNRLFLFQVINFGKHTDELKFTFNYPDAGTGIVYSEARTFTDPTDIMSQTSEITYHNDGTFLHKFPDELNPKGMIYKNPFKPGARRTPLRNLSKWEGILEYTVVDYDICRKPFSKDAFLLPYDSAFFGGEPFRCIICLGSSDNRDLIVDAGEELVARLSGAAEGVDLLMVFTKTDYRGQEIQIPGGPRIWSTSNVLNVVYNRDARPH